MLIGVVQGKWKRFFVTGEKWSHVRLDMFMRGYNELPRHRRGRSSFGLMKGRKKCGIVILLDKMEHYHCDIWEWEKTLDSEQWK